MIEVQVAWINDALEATFTSIEVKCPTLWLEVLQAWQPDIDWMLEKQHNQVLLWSEQFPDEYVCKDGDRFEWVKPLLCDPKEARKKRFKK